MPLGWNASADIIADTNDHISSSSSSMQSKVSKFLCYPNSFANACCRLHSRHYYRFEGEEVVWSHTLPRAIMEISGMYSFDNLNRTYVVFSASRTKNLEAAAKTIVEAMSWMDWWTCSAKSLAVLDFSEAKKVNCFFIAGIWCQLVVARTALMI